MLREYLDEILDGMKTYDAWSYDTNKRWTIALVDTKKSTIIGLIDLVGTHKITAEEYYGKLLASGKECSFKWKIWVLHTTLMTLPTQED